MRTLMITAMAVLAFMIPGAARAAAPAEERAAIQDMRAETLDRLYDMRGDVRQEIENAVGYAVFDSGSLAIVWFSGGYGHGVAHDNRNGKNIYMQMLTGGVGLGLGVKDYNTVFVFHDSKVFEDFINVGLDLSANADLAAKLGAKGGAAAGSVNVLPGVNIYQLTEDGLLAQAMVQGTKYWPDDRLNEAQVSSAAPQPQPQQESERYNQ